MNFWDKLQNIDVRIIYLVLLIVVALPLINPIGLPISYSKETIMAYEAIDALQPGDYIIMSADYDPGGSAELYPANLAVARHAFKKGLKVIGYNQWDLGGQLMKRALDKAAEDYGKQYGVDYVVLGYKIPLTVVLRLAISDAWTAWKADINGTAFDQLPMMADFRAINKDLSMVVPFCSGSPGLANWITYIGTPSRNPGPNNAEGFVRRVPIVSAHTSVEVPSAKASLQSGQISGLIAGGRGAAEYELMVGHPDTGITSMDAQSLGHIAIIVFIILGNIGFLVTRNR